MHRYPEDSMTSVNIEDLFENNRLPEGLGVAAVLLYFPLGVVLAVLRLFIGFHTILIAYLLPKMSAARSLVLRVMCGVLGILVTQDGSVNRDRKVKVIASNYSSTLDHLAVDLVMSTILPCVWDIPPTLMWLLGYTDMGAKQGRDTLIQNARRHIRGSEVPILVFPEGASTNGSVGLLKFSVWPFSLDHPVQPILIQLYRPPFARISPSILGGRWWIDVFWFLFVPYTHFYIRVLPAVNQEEDETVEEFTRRVQKIMASKLGVAATSHTSADKVEYAKRKLIIHPHSVPGNAVANNTSGGPSDTDDELTQMAFQVKEVLPHVPIPAIRQDLALTRDIDLTITNLLEGRVEFTPEEPGVEASQLRSRNQSPSPTNLASNLKFSYGAKSFGKNTGERHLSLEDRKKALLEKARHRYMEKHNML